MRAFDVLDLLRCWLWNKLLAPYLKFLLQFIIFVSLNLFFLLLRRLGLLRAWPAYLDLAGKNVFKPLNKPAVDGLIMRDLHLVNRV